MNLSRSTLRLFRYFSLPERDEQPLSWVIDTVLTTPNVNVTPSGWDR